MYVWHGYASPRHAKLAVVIDSALMMTGVAGTAGALGDGPESAKGLRETNASVTATLVFN